MSSVQGCVYLLRNTVNGKGYVGQHKNAATVESIRWKGHIHAACKGSVHPIHRAIRKYGVEKFSAEVLWTGSVDKLNAKEKFYVHRLNTFIRSGCGYNQTLGGDGVRGFKFSADSIARLKVSSKARFERQEEREKLSSAQLNRFADPEEVKKNSERIKRHHALNPATGQNHSKHMRALYADPARKAVYISIQSNPVTSSKKSNSLSLRYADETYRAAHKTLMSSPTVRKNIKAGALRGWATRRRNALLKETA